MRLGWTRSQPLTCRPVQAHQFVDTVMFCSEASTLCPRVLATMTIIAGAVAGLAAGLSLGVLIWRLVA
jgi:hypothetical protein